MSLIFLGIDPYFPKYGHSIGFTIVGSPDLVGWANYVNLTISSQIISICPPYSPPLIGN